MPQIDSLIVHIDGASRGNPGPAAYGVMVKDAQGSVVIALSKALGKATNNWAEYQALLAALQYAIEHGCRSVKVFSDSELLVRQIQGRYRVKHERLKPLYQSAMASVAKIESFSIVHVPREQNREADALANQVLDAAASDPVHHQNTTSHNESKSRQRTLS
ncbi:MAG: ribonuclease HI family protein [Terriglobia bacterium]